MNLIPRPTYQSWLEEFQDKPLIKVATGLRRAGKSTVLSLFAQSLVQRGAAPEQILMVNFEEFENEQLLDKHRLHQHILDHRIPGKTLYVFLDEVQHVQGYEKVVDSLYVKEGIDLYITGSTADLLSSEIATRLTGRYVEINVLPLSFREYAWGKDVQPGSDRRLFMEYITYGGLPGAQMFPNGSASQREYVENVFKSILEKDVLKRHGNGRFLVDRIIRYMTDNVGNLTSPKRLANRLEEEKRTLSDKKASYNTVVSYLERLTDCFFFYKADRYDVAGGEHLQLINKYYLTDFGFKYYILDNPELELQQMLENVVFYELKRRRYKVATGKVADKEVDFMVQGNDNVIRYIQVAVTVATVEKLEQELAAFKAIRDNYPKYILTLDEIFAPDHQGVRTLNVLDYLLGKADFGSV